MNEGAPPPTERLAQAIIDAAITWSIRLDYNTPSVEEQQAFERWLNADPLHLLAWQRVHSLRGFQGDLGELSPKLALDTLRKAQHHRERHLLSRRTAMKLLSLAGVAVAAGWIAHDNTPWQRLLADASTAVGEQKTLHLDDGSVVVLNTDSAVSIDLDGPRRFIILRRGEILVTTGKDAGQSARRPFWVYTPFGRMQALGTRFVVRLGGQRTRVSVQEGAVELHPAEGGESAVVYNGESRWLTKENSVPAEAQGFDVDGWSEGVITGQNIRLQDLLAELARYRPGRIACDPSVAELRVSGHFLVRDTDRTLQFLAQTQPISVTYRTRYWVMVGASD